MNFLEKIKVEQIKIDCRYDINAVQMREIKEESSGLCDAISYAFTYGYAQGQKAERSHRKNITKPVHKNDFRRAIAGNADKIKNVVRLRTLYRLSEDFASDDATGRNSFYKWAIVHNLTSGKLTENDIDLIYRLIDSFTAPNTDIERGKC
ncbi:hypothetical protein [Robinsoniella peoriensis]